MEDGFRNIFKAIIYSSSPGSDVSTQTQLVSVCTHTLCLCVRASRFAQFHLARVDLEMRFAIKLVTTARR